mmetsp:Transcript_249/g.494  ORF Transcript_249/g.494 Transcript_249/m.494 type:complete len:1100 (-) Transcript_249:117-3416(-)
MPKLKKSLFSPSEKIEGQRRQGYGDTKQNRSAAINSDDIILPSPTSPKPIPSLQKKHNKLLHKIMITPSQSNKIKNKTNLSLNTGSNSNNHDRLESSSYLHNDRISQSNPTSLLPLPPSPPPSATSSVPYAPTLKNDANAFPSENSKTTKSTFRKTTSYRQKYIKKNTHISHNANGIKPNSEEVKLPLEINYVNLNLNTNDDMNVNGDADDPLLALFQVHNTHRVKFNLTPAENNTSIGMHEGDINTQSGGSEGDGKNKLREDDAKQQEQPRGARHLLIGKGGTKWPSSAGLNIKKFVKTKQQRAEQQQQQIEKHHVESETKQKIMASCLHASEDENDDEEEDSEDALLQKMMEPSPPRRMSSFLSSIKALDSRSDRDRSESDIDHILDPQKQHNRQNSDDKCRDKCSNDDDRISASRDILRNRSETGISSPSSESNTNSSSKSPKSLSNKKVLSINPIFSNNKKEKAKTKQIIAKLLRKAHRAHKKSFRYRLAMKYYLLVLKEISVSEYLNNNGNNNNIDQLMSKILKCLNDVHHAQSTLNNSANIVKMGIQHEDKQKLVKALKLYTIAYRMRRDVLSVDHPSLPVLLNMMGSVQIKRGELDEAMMIYELALKGRPDENGGKGRDRMKFRRENPLTTSVTLRDTGMILEHRGLEEKALKFYHASLRYAFMAQAALRDEADEKAGKGVEERFAGPGNGDGDCEGDDSVEDDMEVKGKTGGDILEESFLVGKVNGQARPKLSNRGKDATKLADEWLGYEDEAEENVDMPFSLDEVRMVKSTTMDKNSPSRMRTKLESSSIEDDVGETGEMELFIEKRFERLHLAQDSNQSEKSTLFYYDTLFSTQKERTDTTPNELKKQMDGNDVDIAMTLHQIGQIYRRSHRYEAALSAYNASLRGIKVVFGTQHANIAAILGNIGNLYMETGDYDEAFAIYQEVLGIETLHLGLSHPEVAVTLHNIATIECSRGNYSEGISLYKQVVDMQKIRYGHDHITVSVTLTCLADAYEKFGNAKSAIKTYEEALKIRIGVLGRSHVDVGRLMHKLGRLASSRGDYHIAGMYMRRTAEIYKINKLPNDHLFMKEMARDDADIQAGLAFREKAEC